MTSFNLTIYLRQKTTDYYQEFQQLSSQKNRVIVKRSVQQQEQFVNMALQSTDIRIKMYVDKAKQCLQQIIDTNKLVIDSTSFLIFIYNAIEQYLEAAAQADDQKIGGGSELLNQLIQTQLAELIYNFCGQLDQQVSYQNLSQTLKTCLDLYKQRHKVMKKEQSDLILPDYQDIFTDRQEEQKQEEQKQSQRQEDKQSQQKQTYVEEGKQGIMQMSQQNEKKMQGEDFKEVREEVFEEENKQQKSQQLNLVLPNQSFKDIYNKGREQNPAIFEDKSIAITILDLLRSSESDEQLQNQLLDLIGVGNVEMVFEFINARSFIIRQIEEAEREIGIVNETAHQYSTSVKVKKGAQNQMEKKQKEKYQSNLDLLKNLGIDEKYIDEQNKLGLKERPIFVSEQQAYNAYDQLHTRKAMPLNTKKTETQTYVKYTVPVVNKNISDPEQLLKVQSALDEWAWPTFEGSKTLNTIQTMVYESAYKSNENMLVCAPTGAGKTNIANLCILKVLKDRMDSDGVISSEFKIIYVAPMKALASEVVDKFSKRLKHLGLYVKELTGDMQMSRQEILQTHMIVTTPEKWDVVTRKTESIAHLVKLLIIDEIHLLGEERGPVIEALVARTLRQVEASQTQIRIVGLSATLPNYGDVGQFLRATQIHYFDGSYRPVPLEQNFVGVKKSPNQVKQQNLMNEVAFDILIENLQKEQQVLVFVHARKETVTSAKFTLELARTKNKMSLFSNEEIYNFRRDIAAVKTKELQPLLEYGVGTHNAGMNRKDRNLVESMFKKGAIKVLFTTATLAWGVNLPAHAVIIKGTEIYDPSAGGWKDVGILDVQQIFGRAGRPQFDTSGEATIITVDEKLQKYLRMLTFQAPIESQFLGVLEDTLNAEVSLGTVTSVNDAVEWLQFSYLNTRIRKNPLNYGATIHQVQSEEETREFLADKIRSAAGRLNAAQMIRFNQQVGTLSSTFTGRIASHFYIKFESMQVYNESLKHMTTDDEFFRIFGESAEFKQLQIRQEEIQELEKMQQFCTWIKLEKGDMSTVFGKVAILLQAYLQDQFPNQFSLVSDMLYIAQNGSRIMRALFELCLKRNYADLASRVLNFCRLLDKKMIIYDSPLKQFSKRCNQEVKHTGPFIKDETLVHIYEHNLSIEQLQSISNQELTYYLGAIQRSDEAKRFLKLLPLLNVQLDTQPITGNIIKLTVVLKMQDTFKWTERWHGNSLGYWIWVDNEETIFHSEHILLQKQNQKKGQILSFALPVLQQSSYYYVRIMSDK